MANACVAKIILLFYSILQKNYEAHEPFLVSPRLTGNGGYVPLEYENEKERQMLPSAKTTLIRKVALGIGAIAISTMTLAGAANAKSNFTIHLGFGGPGYIGGYWGPGYGYGYGYGPWGGTNCHWYLKKYYKTGKWYWKKKFYKCKAMYW